MPEWPKGADCKSVVRGFESLSVLQLAGLVELADTTVLNIVDFGRTGSSPVPGTSLFLYFSFFKTLTK